MSCMLTACARGVVERRETKVAQWVNEDVAILRADELVVFEEGGESGRVRGQRVVLAKNHFTPLGELRIWDNKIMVHQDRWWVIDVTTMRAEPFIMPDGGWVLDIASDEHGDPWVLCFGGERHYLLHKRDNRWVTRDLPHSFSTSSTKADWLYLVGGQGVLLVQTRSFIPSAVAVMRGEKWDTQQINVKNERPHVSIEPLDKKLFVNNRLYWFGIRKHFGVDAMMLDLEYKEIHRLSLADETRTRRLSLASMHLLPDKTLWWVAREKPAEEGLLYRQSNGWTRVKGPARDEKDIEAGEFGIDTVGVDWQGRQLIAGRSSGVWRKEAGQWRHLTEFWPAERNAEISHVLMPDENTLIVGTRYAGVLVYDRKLDNEVLLDFGGIGGGYLILPLVSMVHWPWRSTGSSSKELFLFTSVLWML